MCVRSCSLLLHAQASAAKYHLASKRQEAGTNRDGKHANRLCLGRPAQRPAEPGKKTQSADTFRAGAAHESATTPQLAHHAPGSGSKNSETNNRTSDYA